MKIFFRKMLPRSHIGRNIFLLMSGTAAAQLITAVSMPIVTRLYTPEMIGIISIYLSFFGFWTTILTWRFESALLISEDEEESHYVFRLGAVLVLLTAFLGVPVLSSLQHFNVIGFETLPAWSPLVAFLSSLGFGWYMLYRSWLLRLREARVISMSAVARSGANAGTRVLSGILNIGVYGLFLAEILGSWAALGAVRNKTKRILVKEEPKWSCSKLKDCAIKYRKFVQYEMPSVMLNQLAIMLPVPIVGALYGAEAAGWFGLAKLVYAIPNGQIGKSVGDVFQMELGGSVREGDIKKGEKLFYKFSFRLGVVGLLPLFISIFFAPQIVPFIFGDDWEKMGVIVAHMAPWMFMALVVGSMSRALSVLQKQQWKLMYDFSALAVVGCSYFYAEIHHIDLIGFIDVLSVGMSSAYVVYFFVIAFSFKSFFWRV